MIPATEKIIFVIKLGLERNYITSVDVSNFLNCSIRNACRILKRIYDMQHELLFIKCERLESQPLECKRFRIRLNKNFIYS
jgi:hypothetical protein